MATQITSDNFRDYFIQMMSELGKAQESDTDVPEVTGTEVADTNTDHYSMPLLKNQNGIMSYAKIPLGGSSGLIQAVAAKVATEGMLLSVTEDQFNSVFYPQQ